MCGNAKRVFVGFKVQRPEGRHHLKRGLSLVLGRSKGSRIGEPGFLQIDISRSHLGVGRGSWESIVNTSYGVPAENSRVIFDSNLEIFNILQHIGNRTIPSNS